MQAGASNRSIAVRHGVWTISRNPAAAAGYHRMRVFNRRNVAS